MEIKLENESLELTINSFGAELKSITGKETGTQYLWDADEKYWKRSAPVLFQFVGSLKDKKFTVDGTDYPMGLLQNIRLSLCSKSAISSLAVR